METAIIEACGRGEAQAWERFIAQYGRLVRATVARVARRFAVSETDLDDIVGHVYEKLLEDDCRRLRAWRGRARLSTYLVQVVRNLVLNYQAQATRGPQAVALENVDEPPMDAVDHGAVEEDQNRLKALYDAMEQMPPHYALILRLRLEGHSLREIAALQKKPVGTVSVENSRALKKLRSLMERLLSPEQNNDETRGC